MPSDVAADQMDKLLRSRGHKGHVPHIALLVIAAQGGAILVCWRVGPQEHVLDSSASKHPGKVPLALPFIPGSLGIETGRVNIPGTDELPIEQQFVSILRERAICGQQCKCFGGLVVVVRFHQTYVLLLSLPGRSNPSTDCVLSAKLCSISALTARRSTISCSLFLPPVALHSPQLWAVYATWAPVSRSPTAEPGRSEAAVSVTIG